MSHVSVWGCVKRFDLYSLSEKMGQRSEKVETVFTVRAVWFFFLEVDTLQTDIIPADVRHFDAITGQHFDAVLEPFPRHFFIRHFTLEYSLFSRLHCQVSDALQHLQLFIWGEDTNMDQHCSTPVFGYNSQSILFWPGLGGHELTSCNMYYVNWRNP